MSLKPGDLCYADLINMEFSAKSQKWKSQGDMLATNPNWVAQNIFLQAGLTAHYIYFTGYHCYAE